MRTRPIFPPLPDALAVRLSRSDVALYWGYVRGVDARALHARYSPDEEAANRRRLKTLVRGIAAELAAAVHRTGRPHLAGLFLRDPHSILDPGVHVPMLEAFRWQLDPSGDFYSEAEILALWQEAHAGPAAPASTRDAGQGDENDAAAEDVGEGAATPPAPVDGRSAARDAAARAQRAAAPRARLLQRLRAALAWLKSKRDAANRCR